MTSMQYYVIELNVNMTRYQYVTMLVFPVAYMVEFSYDFIERFWFAVLRMGQLKIH